MPYISEKEHNHYTLADLDLNQQLEKIFNETRGDKIQYDHVRDLIADDKLLPITDEVYSLLFLNKYPWSTKFLLILEDKLQDIAVFFMKHAPKDFVCGEPPQHTIGNIPLIPYAFSYRQKSIPDILKVISKSGRSDIVIDKQCVESFEWYEKAIEENISFDIPGSLSPSDNLEDYRNAREAMKKYCTENEDGSYAVIPPYLVPVKNESQELKKCLNDIAFAIDSNDLDKVKNTLGEIGKIKGADYDVYSVNEALCILAQQAKSNKEIVYAISDCQASITYTMLAGHTNAQASPNTMLGDRASTTKVFSESQVR